MPPKICKKCPECLVSQHIARKVCQCGHEFRRKRRVGVIRDNPMMRRKQRDAKRRQRQRALEKGLAETLQQLKQQKMTVECNEKKSAPVEMARGPATSDGQFAYFAPFNSLSLYQYEYSTEKWETLPECPYRYFGLAIIDNELTTVGGIDGCDETNKLMTLLKGEWVEEYPPMNTGRYCPAVVTTPYCLIVISGKVGGNWSTTVDMLHLESGEWYTATELPKPFPFPSATICGDQLNVIAYESQDCLSCSIKDLPSSDQPISSPLMLSWIPLPPLPVTNSTAASLCGHLVLMGGREGGSTVNSVYQLVDDGQWMKIGSMTRGRWSCLAVNSSPDKILIVGGYNGSDGAENSIEDCILVWFIF